MRLPDIPFLTTVRDVARSTVFPVDLASSKRRFVLIYFVRLCFLVGRRFWSGHCPRHAAALSFQTLLSMVPLLAVALVVATALDMGQYQDRMITFLQANLVPSAAREVVQQVIQLGSAFRTKTLGIVSGTTLVIIAITLLFTVEGTINEIFGYSKRRKFVRRLIIAFTVLLFAPLALGLSIYLTGELLILPRFASASIPLLLTITALFFCYWLLPPVTVQLRHSLISAAIAGVIFEITKVGFAFYTRYLGETLSYVYGTFAILPLFMVWLYLAWIIFLFGAEFNAALHEVRYHNRFSEK
jgi:membrane protein